MGLPANLSEQQRLMGSLPQSAPAASVYTEGKGALYKQQRELMMSTMSPFLYHSPLLLARNPLALAV